MSLTPEACRAARGLLKWGVRDLSAKTGGPLGADGKPDPRPIGFDTITEFENGRPMRDSNAARIVAAFDAAGVEILNGDAPGARFKPGARG